MQVYPPLLLLNRQGKCKYFILNPKYVFWWSRHLGLRPHLNSLTMKIVLCRCSNKKECFCSSHERNKTWIHTRKTIPLYDQSITNLKKRIEMIFFYENQYVALLQTFPFLWYYTLFISGRPIYDWALQQKRVWVILQKKSKYACWSYQNPCIYSLEEFQKVPGIRKGLDKAATEIDGKKLACLRQ